MRRTLLGFVLLALAVVGTASAIDEQSAQPFVGQDLHLKAAELISYQLTTGNYVLVFRGGFSMLIGANEFSSDDAVVWIESVTTEYRGRVRVDYNATAYLRGNLVVRKSPGARTTDLVEQAIEPGRSLVVRFSVGGEVLVTATKRESFDPRELALYKEAEAAVRMAVQQPRFYIQPSAKVPTELPEAPAAKAAKKKKPPAGKPPVGFVEQAAARAQAEPTAAAAKQPRFIYPVNISPAGTEPLGIETTRTPDGLSVTTVIGRLYVWQKQDEQGRLLEMQADRTVIFRSGTGSGSEQDQNAQSADELLAGGSVVAIYMAGNVVMTEGQRTLRADEMYYDFTRKKAIAVNAVMRNFDVQRGIPIYVRAQKLHQIAENKFAAENITLTTSEFYLPQVSLNASTVIITDTTTIDAEAGRLSRASYEAEMRDVSFKWGRRTLFRWPYLRTNLQRPDVPLKSVRVGHDNTWGTSFETRWYLSRLLGLRETEGVDSTFGLDYFSKRGIGSSVEIDYQQENYFGDILAYVISDSGEDRLGRHSMRKDVSPPRDLRGRVTWRHRQFLPYKWQLTTGVSYISDENFLEQYYRSEFNTDLPQETYIYLKRIEDNWAVDLLGKIRINNFADELEEQPSLGYHIVGQSLFDDRFTLYSDTQISRLRQRIGNDHPITLSDKWFAFVSHRTELDMPFSAGPASEFRIVPFVAGTFAYDDRSGFRRSLVDGSYSGSFGEDQVWIGEAGVRASSQYWKVYPNARSRLLDVNQLRHIIRPSVTAIYYAESDSVVEQRDILNVGISQRLQTRRGPADNPRTIDWMRLDLNATWVKDSAGADSGPDRFIWNDPAVPMRVFSAPEIFHGELSSGLGLQRFEMWGPRRNYFGADYIWRASDTAAVLSDLYYDMQSGVVEQFDIGLTRLVWPNLSYYIGSRYLRRVEVLGEKGSNAFTFAATYVLDPRYTVVFAQQYDFDYGANVRSDITFIRKYHRIKCGITFSADASLDRQSIIFTIWPEGVPELAIGSTRYMGLGGSAGY